MSNFVFFSHILKKNFNLLKFDQFLVIGFSRLNKENNELNVTNSHKISMFNSNDAYDFATEVTKINIKKIRCKQQTTGKY